MLSLWAPLAVPLLVTVAWLWVPGFPVALVLRVPRALSLAVAPLLSLAMICLAAIAAPMAGMTWGPLPAALTVVVTWIVIGGGRLGLDALRRRRSRPAVSHPASAAEAATSDDGGEGADGTDHADAPAAVRATPRSRRGRSLRDLATSVDVLTLAATALASLLMARHVRNIIGRPDALSQTFDNIFHQNAVRWILDHGNASSLHLLAMTASPGDSTFYPAAWHDTVSLVLESTGSTDIPVATNALALTACALIWTTGMIALIRAALPSSLERAGIVIGAVLTASFPTFPILFLHFGVLYPNLLGLCLLPAMAVILLRVVGLATRTRLSWPATVAIGLLGAISLSLAHPNVSMTLMVMAIPITLAATGRAVARALSGRVRGGWIAPAVLAALALGAYALAAAIWPVIRPPEEALTWPPVMSETQALGQAIAMNPLFGWAAWSLTALFGAGLYASIRHRAWALPLAWGVVVFLWLAVASWPEGEARTALVGVWYNDPYRIAAVLAIPAIPIATLGTAHALRSVAELFPRRRATAALALSVVAVLVLFPVTQRSARMDHAVDVAAGSYRLSDDSQLLTSDEMALIQRMPELVPPDTVVIVDASNGGSLLYAYTGIRTTTLHTLEHRDADDRMFEEHLDEAATDPAVCRAVRAEHATYVLDLGDQQVNHTHFPRPGYEDLASAPGFTEVAHEGPSATLYRIEACDG